MNFDTPQSDKLEQGMLGRSPETSNNPVSHMAPSPVVSVLSPNGIEYVFMTIALFGTAIAFAVLLLQLVNGVLDFNALAFPIASLLVLLPVFSFLFLRLKKRELREPTLRFDASKRRSTQFTQIVTFTTCLLTLIGFVFAILSKFAGGLSMSLVKISLDMLCILLIAGGILFYYWRDEHKVAR